MINIQNEIYLSTKIKTKRTEDLIMNKTNFDMQNNKEYLWKYVTKAVKCFGF